MNWLDAIEPQTVAIREQIVLAPESRLCSQSFSN